MRDFLGLSDNTTPEQEQEYSEKLKLLIMNKPIKTTNISCSNQKK